MASVDNGAGLVIKFKGQIPQRSLVVLGGASNVKILLCYVKKLCSVASTVRDFSDTPKNQKLINVDSLPENTEEVKSVS